MNHRTFFKNEIKNKRKWKRAKFSQTTRQSIYERDWGICIFCHDRSVTAHHIYFWCESNYDDDRNNISQWVTVCQDHHSEIHSCSKWSWKRQEAIEYLLN